MSKKKPQSSGPWNSFCYAECKEKDEKHNLSQDIKNKWIHFCLESLSEEVGFEWETLMSQLCLY